MIPTPAPGDSNARRTRVTCPVCGQVVELARLRDHLRAEHQATSAEVDAGYLNARIEAKRSRRTQSR
jgi:adenine-specific DNA methylase